MSFGGGAKKAAAEARTPHSVYTPFGSVVQNGNDIFLNGAERERGLMDSTVNPMQGIINSFNGVGDAGHYAGLARNQATKDRTQQQKDLDNRLSASNQLGSSYAALQNRQLEQDYQDRLQNADLFGLQTQGQDIQNKGGALGALSGYLGEATNRGLAPLQAAQGYYSGYFGPQNQTAAQAYMQPSALGGILSGLTGLASMAIPGGPAVKAATGFGGNALSNIFKTGRRS